ncbi:hypothetical protein FCE95_14615 [Luteimonas gilva]|uniref:DUF2147 domain-containing protein n=1 Tax=Luteimonas gilva TaxID=2572684 RepID=A0A4U5JIH4_9GAMM|nr:hypothetical protein [Luteimonas gilva]TKR29380.1 hypothetical protein FCE95_14615 [Luteimonas gilva]
MHNLMIASLLAITVISASSCVKPISNHKPATHSPFEGGWRLTTSCGTSHYIGITLTQQGDEVYGTWVDDTNTIRSSGKIKGVIKSGTLRMESCSNDIESELAYNYCPQLVSDYFSIEMGNLVWYHSSGYRYAVLQKCG